MVTIEGTSLDELLGVLKKNGYITVGPMIRDHAIIYDEVDSSQNLPIGYGDEQDGGTYRLVKRDDDAFFGYVVGPDSFKKYLFPQNHKLWSATRTDDGFAIQQTNGDAPAYALIGIRPCELEAIAIQDRVFLRGDFVDPIYRDLREKIFTVAVNCGQAAATCFCTSMSTGPKATSGYDISLTEVIEVDRHYFVVEAGTERGRQILSEVPHRDAKKKELSAAQKATDEAVSQMARSMDTADIKELLYRNHTNSRWDDVAKRCLTCGNCTMVCPTCFCSNVEDVTDLTGDNAERWRRWDSCFTADFSYIAGGSVRHTPKSRYRQWITHKLASWIDQFGTSGCVGCGRCITWCPVGIDITEEVKAIRQTDGQTVGAS